MNTDAPLGILPGTTNLSESPRLHKQIWVANNSPWETMLTVHPDPAAGHLHITLASPPARAFTTHCRELHRATQADAYSVSPAP
jgi:hypothetical protein